MPKRVALTSLIPSASAALEPSAVSAPITEPMAQQSGVPATTTGPTESAYGSRSLKLPRTSAHNAEDASPHADRGHRHYSELVRKEARLRDDQIDALATHARRLSRAKTGSDERITDNTLIRIAVDLLLRESPALIGSTERQLRESVGL